MMNYTYDKIQKIQQANTHGKRHAHQTANHVQHIPIASNQKTAEDNAEA
jgi:hypothetical protein